MSRVIKGGSLGEFGPGDLHMLLLRLKERKNIRTSVVSFSRAVSSCCDIPQRPSLQRAVFNHVRSLQDRIRRRGQAHA